MRMPSGPIAPTTLALPPAAARPSSAADGVLAECAAALRNFLGARCRDDDLTTGMVQGVAAGVVTATPRLSLNGNVRGYLFRIAANVWRDHVRRELVRRRAAVTLESV